MYTSHWRTFYIFIFGIVFTNYVYCFPVYRSCQDVIQKLGSNATDGEYVIYPKTQKFGLLIFCSGFSSGNPQEYLTLHAGRSNNFASYYDYIGSETSCGDKSPKQFSSKRGRTEFDKVRFDIDNMHIIQSDFTFTHQIGPNKIRYATAGDSFSSSGNCSPRGTFKIDLVGTPFMISKSVQWMWTGNFYHGRNSSSRHNAKIYKSKYIGCYEDKLSDRLLPSLFYETDTMTQEICIEHCKTRGFRFAGLQYYSQCYCGDTCCKFGKVNDTECSTPCRGDNTKMCGGHWKTGVFGTGIPQSVEGKCGGYPGRCYPSVSTHEGLALAIVPEHTCAHTPPICQNEGGCVALTASKHKCQCYEGYSQWDCSVLDENIVSGSSKCPAGFQPEKCSCGSKCSGAKFEGDMCIVTSGSPKVTCRFGNPGHVILFNVNGIGSVQCPDGSDLTGCTYWDRSGKRITPTGEANMIRYSSGSCSLTPSCETCQLQARCKRYDCGCLNQGHCHKVTGQCVCKDGYYGNKCEFFDYCGFYTDTYNASACGAEGICTAVPQQQIKTYGGDNIGGQCLFPFTFQGTKYGQCIESNEVGPPFACGVSFDGSENSFIDAGPWSPGPNYTVAAWVRPTGAGKTRRTVAGGAANCRDFGIFYFENFWAFYKGSDYGCARGIDSGVAVRNGQWYLVATTNNGTHVTIYVNGHTNVVKVKPYLLPTTYGFWIGGEQCCTLGRTKGLIKTVKVWKRALTPAEIESSMKNTGNDNSTYDALHGGLVGHWELGETINPPYLGTNHGGQDWTLTQGQAISGVHYNISRFYIPSSISVSMVPWNGFNSTGTLSIFAQVIQIDGFLDGSAAGYRGGASPSAPGGTGFQGESNEGHTTASNANNRGGGGGGVGGQTRSDKRGQPGGGGGFGSVGQLPTKRKGDRVGFGTFGVTYGDTTLKPLLMGSGGGSGGSAFDLTGNPKGGKGGNGGGAISLVAQQSIVVKGVISVRGGNGQGDVSTTSGCTGCPGSCSHRSIVDCYGSNTTACWDMSGPGGGGSGGSIYIEGKLVDIGHQTLWAMGGNGGFGTEQGCGGDGGLGRIRVNSVTFKGFVSSSQGVFTQGTMENKFQDHSQAGQKLIDYRDTVYGNEVYRGCFRDDNMQQRLLVYTQKLTSQDKSRMTPEYCIKLCRNMNYRYSATEYGYECFCGDHLNMNNKVADGDCNMPCTGNGLMTCGASFRAQVFGPPPETPAEAHGRALQKCEPWCVTADANPDNPDKQKWGLCSMSDQGVASWDIHCECPVGYSGIGCKKPCEGWTFGKSCVQNCSCNINNTAVCNTVTGQCQCKAGFTGLTCDSECPPGTFGTNCMGKCNCSDNGKCDKINGACICKPGWYGLNCKFLCPSGRYGYNCSSTCYCNDHGTCDPQDVDGGCECEPGYKLPYCADPCDDTDYGPDCKYNCDCNGQPCDHFTGVCKCNPGFTGKKCELTCPHGTFGYDCKSQCSCALDISCDPVTGRCLCGPGSVGRYCQDPCPDGSYGIDCQQRCHCVSNQTAYCEPSNGICHCKEGFIGENCGNACPFGFYGEDCTSQCTCMNGAPCDPATGKCLCPAGWMGPKCQMPCQTGFYGKSCKNQCPSCSNGGICNRATGSCICGAGQDCTCPTGFYGNKCDTACNCNHGTCVGTGQCRCRPGWQGDHCNTPCQSGFYGTNCQLKCNCVNGKCPGDTGVCICDSGYSGFNCSTPCKSGFYGPDCRRPCPKCSKFAKETCDPFNGTCSCKPGYSGALCDRTCPAGYYGDGCLQQCNCNKNHSYCNSTNGKCTCFDGYTGSTCDVQCTNGTWGPNCINKCDCGNNSETCHHANGVCVCKPGFVGVKCHHSCVIGYWGKACLKQCNCSKDGSETCNPTDGICQCKPGYMGPQCFKKCPAGRWGTGCINICECNNRGVCDTNNGECDCDPGYQGNNCGKECKQGVYWGKRCANKCDCNGEYCDPRDGTCRCPPGKTGYRCEIHCTSGYFGFQCAQPCHCKNGAICNPVNGMCKCQPGWSGRFCDQSCPPGMYGLDCTETCPQCLNGASCDAALGVCKCSPGYTGPICNQTCPSGSWGDLCSLKCSPQCRKGCQPQTGVCNCEDWSCRNGGICTDQGTCLCSGGYSGDDCNTYVGVAKPLAQTQSQNSDDVVTLTTTQVVGIAIGILVVIAIVIVAAVVLMRKKYTGRMLGTSGTIKYDGRRIEVDDGGFSNPLHADNMVNDSQKETTPQVVPELSGGSSSVA